MWGRQMPVGMYLKSEGFASNLSDPSGEYTLERFCAEDESGYEYARIAAPIPLDTFERYGRWFQQRLVPSVRENRVNSVKRTGAVFEVRLDTGDTLRGKSVVMATGMTGYVHLPRPLQDLPSKAVVHTYDQRDPGRSRGTDVAVIGAGQSALESAALMHEQGAKVWVIARASKLAWNSRPGGPDRPLRARCAIRSRVWVRAARNGCMPTIRSSFTGLPRHDAEDTPIARWVRPEPGGCERVLRGG